MACERYVNAIHELVDGTLGPLRRAELELHLETCEDCRGLAGDLRELSRAARSLEPVNPPAGAWTAIAARLRQEGPVASPARRPQLHRSHTVLALAAALILAVAASFYLLLPRGGAGDVRAPQAAVDVHPEGNAPPADPVQGVASEVALIEGHMERLIEAAKTEDGMDPRTVAVLQNNLQVMNKAIAESRAALESDPQSAPARQSLYDTLKQKIQFLQDTIALMNEMRKGDAAGAAQIVEGGKSS